MMCCENRGVFAAESEVAVLVDRSGRVVGTASRAAVRRENLLHAATAVLVRDPAGRIYLHRRAEDKDWTPGFHDCAAGGMIQAGERPEASARRELAEELGITGCALRPLGTSLYEDDSTRCLEHCYEVVWDGPVRHADGEVVWGAWVTLEQLDERLRDAGWRFVPDTRTLLARLATEGVGDYPRLASLRVGRP
jgi:isopentenyldiphosphate isomerase